MICHSIVGGFVPCFSTLVEQILCMNVVMILLTISILLNAVQFPHYFVKCSAMYNNYTSNYCQVFFGTTC